MHLKEEIYVKRIKDKFEKPQLNSEKTRKRNMS